MNDRAVIIAGDYRSFDFGAVTMRPFLEGADIFFSSWSSTALDHDKLDQMAAKQHSSVSKERVLGALKDLDVIDIQLDNYDRRFWAIRKYNSSYVFRWNRGIQLLEKHGKDYDNVLVLRPDLFFGKAVAGQLLEKFKTMNENSFVTNWMDAARIQQKTLNDTLFAVKHSKLRQAVPTLKQLWQDQLPDWHQFCYDFVITRAGFEIDALDNFESIILRPPLFEGITFSQAAKNEFIHHVKYVLFGIEKEGYVRTCNAWTKQHVDKSIRWARENSPELVAKYPVIFDPPPLL